ncbi:hypothetical protein M406DRAFT_233998, partial [Cryphonectria parasitica EP155]
YVLTLLTDQPHHARMTALRKQYFPPRLNKLSAHITLFHALPSHKLASSVLPALERVAAQTTPFEVCATGPFRLRRGIAIGLAGEGRAKAGEVHGLLQREWRAEGWLSVQDAAEGWRGHYTIMNKVEDEGEVERALGEVRRGWKGDDVGRAEGFGLWRYERGWWVWERRFAF